MKNRILVVLTALLYLTVGYAGNISVDNISLKPGETKALTISLSSSVGSNVGVQFDLTLPDGFTLEKNGDAIYTVSTNQPSDLACSVKDLGNGVFRFVLYSNSLQNLKAGELMSVNLKANSSKELGSYTISLSGIGFSDGDGLVTKESDVQATIKVTNFFTLLYKVDGETYKTYEIEYGASITPEPTPTKEGYTFSGWSEIPEKMPAHDVTVTGSFTINKYKLIYKVDGVEYKSYEIEYGTTITPEPAPTKEGYNFSGWSEIPATMPAHDVTVTGSFTIEDPVTVTAKSYSRKYGEANPTFEYTTSGARLSGTPSITCTATATSPVGEYDIVVSKGSITNYNVTLVNGKLTVTKAPLTIAAKSYTIKQGDALPTFEAEYAGFKNNETSSVLSSQPRITTTATSTDVAGEYDINVSGADAQNYDISYVKGKLIIEIVDVDPITETETTTFSSEMNESTDLSNTVIGNTYYSMNAENGDGYDATEQAIVLNSTTTADQMNTVQNATMGNAAIKQNFNGIIFEIAAGTGAVYVDVKTKGTHVLKVQIGKGAPTTITKTERETVGIDYNVSEPTYVYLYASTASGGSAPLKRASAGANSVLLYGYKVTPGSNTGIGVLTVDDMENGSWYTVDGRKLQGKPTTKGLYIINGRKVVVK